ncbi:MAG: hypothetical protein ACI86X_002393 [Moritella sp.]|jgi:hypothetical protein
MMAAKFYTREAQPADSDALIKLIVQTPQQGAITINFERSPDFFMATKVVTQAPDVWVAIERNSDKIAAVFSIGQRDVYVNGKRQAVRYGNDLRIHPNFQSGRTLFNLLKCYREVMGSEWMQTVILSDNSTSLNTMGSGRSITPTYYDFGSMVTHMLYLTKLQSRLDLQLTVRRANHNDIDLIQEFFDQQAKKKQFYPHYDFIKLLDGDDYYRGLEINDYFLMFAQDKLVAMAGIWDQSEFKQTRFVSYNKMMSGLRVINNLYSQLFGGLKLPPPGGKLNYVSLHTLLVIDDDSHYFEQLVKHIYNFCLEQGYQALVCGLPELDLRQPVLQQYRSKVLHSKHFIASYKEDPRAQFQPEYPLYLEPARL